MVNRNIQMKKKNNDEWENLFPLTLNENVFNNDGLNLNDQLNEIVQNVDSLEQNQNIISENKRNKGESILFSVDYKKQSNETDDEFINRLLKLLPDEQGTLVLDGEYILEDSIVLTKYQHLQGSGHSTNLRMNVTNKDIIRLEVSDIDEYVYGVKISNLSINGNVTLTGINLKKCSHLKIEDVYIYDTGWGIKADSAWLAQYDRVTVRNYHTMGKIGIKISAGTSNLFNNCWVKNFENGYHTESMYTTFNSCACDTFTKGAYFVGQASTLNSCGAEDGRLVTDGFVFGAGARPVVFNACETMAISYSGAVDSGGIFYLNGSQATINNYAHSGTIPIPENMSLILIQGGSYINFVNPRLGAGHTGTRFNFDKYQSRSSSVFFQVGSEFKIYRWNGIKNFVTETVTE